MKLILSLLALSILPAAAHAGECTLNFKELKSAIDVSRSAVTSKTKVRYDRRELVLRQSITRKDGQVVNYQAGGCEHYAYAFTFPKVALMSDSIENFKRAAVLLSATPVTKAGANERDTLITNLRAATEASNDGEDTQYFPCGDATCSVGQNEAGEFAVSYMFAL